MQQQSVNSSSLTAVNYLQLIASPDALIFKSPNQSYRQVTS